MKSKKIKTSIIIVNYRADAYVRAIQEVMKNDPEIECIVVDNSSGKKGYGAGCNRGVEQAHGETVLFVNPDIEITTKTVHCLHDFLIEHPNVGIVGPQIKNKNGEIEITCSALPTPLQASILFSWLHKLSFFQEWTKSYRLHGFDHKTSRPVPSVNGSCFMMRREDFLEIGACDENIFLYFEEFDLAKRMQDQLEKQAYFLTACSIVHVGQESTKQADHVSQHFRKSRQYWLQKHYGVSGLLADAWIRLWEFKS